MSEPLTVGSLFSGIGRIDLGLERAGNTPENSLLGRMVKPSQTAGSLHPAFPEWLMGFPIGWTDCGASGTRSCRKLSSSSDGPLLPSMRGG